MTIAIAPVIRQKNIMLWATACAYFFGFMSAGELTVPSESAYYPGAYSDVSIIQHS